MVTSTTMSCAVLPNRRTKLRLECRIASDTARLAALVASLPWTSTPMPISVTQRTRAIRSLRRFAMRNALLDIQLQDIVEAVERAAQRDAPGQLDDLRFGKMLPQ